MDVGEDVDHLQTANQCSRVTQTAYFLLKADDSCSLPLPHTETGFQLNAFPVFCWFPRRAPPSVSSQSFQPQAEDLETPTSLPTNLQPTQTDLLTFTVFYVSESIKLHKDWDIQQNYSLYPNQCITPNTNSFLSDSSKSRYQDTIVHILHPTLDQHELMLHQC